MREELTSEDIAAFEPTEKVGIVATIGDTGEPHATLLSSIMGRGPRGLCVGEFSVGLGKENMRRRPRVGFLVMTLDRRLWRGKARWTGLAKEGPEYEAYNRKPMFRYNTYFGVNTAHYLDLLEVEGPEPLPMARIACSWMATAALAPLAGGRGQAEALSPYARGILDAVASLSFAAWIGEDGFPALAPVVQARSAGPGRVIFTPGPYRRDLERIPDRSRVALFCMNLSMESVLVRGQYRAPGKAAPSLAAIDLDYVYNSMPPCHGQAYPRPALEAVAEF